MSPSEMITAMIELCRDSVMGEAQCEAAASAMQKMAQWHRANANAKSFVAQGNNYYAKGQSNRAAEYLQFARREAVEASK